MTDLEIIKEIEKILEVSLDDASDFSVFDLESHFYQLNDSKHVDMISLWGLSVMELNKIISSLKKLKNLTSLFLCDYDKDISPLRELKNLTSILVERTNVCDLSPLQELKNLDSLELTGNEIVDISPLRELKNLTYANLSYNEIKVVPKFLFERNIHFNLDENPIEIPPYEIVKQGKKAALQWYKENEHLYFQSISVENIKCFKTKQTLNFIDDDGKPAMWNLILGDNGTGKTTLLRILAEMFPYKNDKTKEYIAALPYSLHLPSSNAVCELHSNALLNPLTFGKEHNIPFENEMIENLVIFSYGAVRKIGNNNIETTKNENLTSYFENSTLFNENATLINANEWLLQIDYAQKNTYNEHFKKIFEKIKHLLIEMLPDVSDIRIQTDIEKNLQPTTNVEFLLHDSWMKMREMSLGYQTLAAWMVDFAAKMFSRYPDSENPLAEAAIVLVDEIDLHLHPLWQRKIIHHLTNIFKKTQFIVTAHSPLIVQSAKNANIVLLKWNENSVEIINRKQKDIEKWRFDQILTSDFFDLDNLYPYEYELLAIEREKILSKNELSQEDDLRLQEIGKKLDELPLSKDLKDDSLEIIRKAAEILKTNISL